MRSWKTNILAAWLPCRFKRGFGEKEGVVFFLRGEVDTNMNLFNNCVMNKYEFISFIYMHIDSYSVKSRKYMV